MIEVRPYGVKCNIRCKYCYQENERNHAGAMPKVDLDYLRNKIIDLDSPFSLFGGEPLIMPIKEVEKLFEWGFQRFGENRIQTNGVLINDDHMTLFKRYNVHVGISVDGPEELNQARWAGSIERTNEASQKTLLAIDRLCYEGIPPSIIITLHKENATPDVLDKMSNWIIDLEKKGVKNVRLHVLEVDSPEAREHFALSEEESIQALLHFYSLEQEQLKTLSFDIFQDVEKLMMADDGETACVWHACDPLTTPAVQGLEGNGTLSNCGRTNKEGVGFLKNKEMGYDRYISLYQTPQSENGCKDCRFFLICKGQCPGTSVNGDWRNRSEHCEIWMKVFEVIEQKLEASGKKPISKHPNRTELEKLYISLWKEQKNVLLKDLCVDWEEKLKSYNDINLQEGFINPSNLRLSWTSANAQAKHEQMLNALVHSCNSLKINAVKKGILEYARLRIPIEAINDYSIRTQQLGLHLEAVGSTNSVFSSVVTSENQIELNILVSGSTPNKISQDVHGNGDYFSFSHFTNSEYEDIVLYDDPLRNILFAPLGISIIPLSDSNNKISENTAKQLIELYHKSENLETIQLLKSVLSWPIELSCLHGIAQGKTPIFKYIFGTDYTSNILKVDHFGKEWPEQGARGIRFPFKMF